jgi:hypothetical protein
MDTGDEIARIRTLRAKGFSPEDIARALGVPPATAARLVRAIATEQNADPAEREVLECWVSPGWSVGLTIDGHLEWLTYPGRTPVPRAWSPSWSPATRAGAGSASAATWWTCTAWA